MNIDKEIVEFLKLNLHKGCLESFGIKQQFIELEFSNLKFEEIKFFIDCPINTLDCKTNKYISSLKELNEDTYEIAYFLKANLKCISDCFFDRNGDFQINFENNYNVIFFLSKNEDANLSITFKENENSEFYQAVDILSKGELIMN